MRRNIVLKTIREMTIRTIIPDMINMQSPHSWGLFHELMSTISNPAMAGLFTP